MFKHKFSAAFGLFFAILIFAQAEGTELRIGVNHVPSPICFVTRDTISVNAFDIATPITSFRLTFALAENSQTFLDVLPGGFMSSCNWEYLGWKIDRTTPIENSPGYGPKETAILEINGAASTTVGHVPSCLQGGGEQELVKIIVAHATSSGSTNAACNFVPFRFYWRDCRDNSLVTAGSDTVLVAGYVSEPSNPTGTNPPGFLFPGYGAPASSCNSTGGATYLSLLVARNGGFDLNCTDTFFVCRGDINCNGIPAEVSDAVTFLNYFVIGLPAFGPHSQCSIFQSDVNADGVSLSIADLVFLIRSITGDQGM